MTAEPPGPYAPPPSGWQPPPPVQHPPYGAPPGWQPPPPVQHPPYGAPPGWQPPPPPYGYAPQYAGYQKPRNTNGFAIASLVLAILGVFPLMFIGPVLAFVFGGIAMKATAGGREGGRGLAIAGLVVAGVALLLDIIGVVAIAHSHTQFVPAPGLNT